MSLLDGKHGVPALPGNVSTSGVDLGSAIVIPPGGQVYYVRGDGTTTTEYDYDPPGLRERLIASVAKALTYCVASRGDVIVCLPGHTESLAAANSWAFVIGVRIIGLGQGTRRPTFTWTVAASTALMNKAGISIENCILKLEPGTGTVTVAAPITISAAGCGIKGCQIFTGTDANNLTTIALTTATGADDLEFIGNEMIGATAAECTTMIHLVGVDRLKFIGNTVIGATSSAGVGVVRFASTANTNIVFANNMIINNKAASTVAVTGTTGESGFVHMTLLGTQATTTAVLTGTAWANGTASSLIYSDSVVVANGTGKSATKFGVAAA